MGTGLQLGQYVQDELVVLSSQAVGGVDGVSKPVLELARLLLQRVCPHLQPLLHAPIHAAVTSITQPR
jgi:hypothetical protein